MSILIFMAKQSAIEQDGIIVEALSNAMFRVELDNGHEITVGDTERNVYFDTAMNVVECSMYKGFEQH